MDTVCWPPAVDCDKSKSVSDTTPLTPYNQFELLKKSVNTYLLVTNSPCNIEQGRGVGSSRAIGEHHLRAAWQELATSSEKKHHHRRGTMKTWLCHRSWRQFSKPRRRHCSVPTDLQAKLSTHTILCLEVLVRKPTKRIYCEIIHALRNVNNITYPWDKDLGRGSIFENSNFCNALRGRRDMNTKRGLIQIMRLSPYKFNSISNHMMCIIAHDSNRPSQVKSGCIG